MTTQTLTATRGATASRDILGVALAMALGLGLIFVAGFSHAAGMHDVAHDQRHAIGFPCH